MQKLVFRITAVLFSALWTSHGAMAHDFWIEPSRFVLEEPALFGVNLREGENLKGDSVRYIPDWTNDFSRVDQSGREPIASQMGSDPASIIESTPGMNVIGYQSNRFFVELEPDKFESYLLEENLDYVLAQREERGEADLPATEYFVRCVKSFVQTGSDTSGDIFATELGYTLELIPEDNPYTLNAGDSLSVRLHFRGEPIEGMRVRAYTRDLAQTPIDQWTDSEGRVSLNLSEPGEWLIKAVHLVPVENDPKARWESFWASLTFQLD